MGDQKTPSAPVMMILLNDIISISPGLVPLERKGGQMKKKIETSFGFQVTGNKHPVTSNCQREWKGEMKKEESPIYPYRHFLPRQSQFGGKKAMVLCHGGFGAVYHIPYQLCAVGHYNL
jgi:hypothetical protein